MKRRAFTLVELTVTTAIAVVIFGAALMVYNFSNRSRGVTATARALQTALFIQEQLTTDLGRLVLAGAAPLSVPGDDPARLSFYAYDPALGKGAAMKVRGYGPVKEAAAKAVESQRVALWAKWPGEAARAAA